MSKAGLLRVAAMTAAVAAVLVASAVTQGTSSSFTGDSSTSVAIKIGGGEAAGLFKGF